MNKKLLFGLIGAIVATGAFGEATTQTIPTQGYVDDNFQTKIPAAGTNASELGTRVVTYTGTAGELGERNLFNTGFARVRAQPTSLTSNKGSVTTLEGLYDAIKNISDPSLGTNGLVSATSATESQWIPVFDGSKLGFQYILTANTVEQVGNRDPSQYIPTMKAMESKQNKMTCTRWLDTPENPDHTDENCLLWELGN